MAAIVNPGDPRKNRIQLQYNFHTMGEVIIKNDTPHLEQDTHHRLFEYMCEQFSDPKYWQTLKWTMDKESTQQHDGPCKFKGWKKVVREIFEEALQRQAAKYGTKVVIDLYASEPQTDTQHPEWMQQRWRRYLSKNDTLDGIESLSQFSVEHSRELIVIYLALTQSFIHPIAREYAVDLFKSMLKDWKINPPHHDQTQINAHTTLLHQLIKTLSKRPRRR
jgi:hypothetical protein